MSGVRWSREDTARLAQFPDGVQDRELIEAFPERSLSSLTLKRRQLRAERTGSPNLRDQPEPELSVLDEAVLRQARKGLRTVAELADSLDRGPASIRQSIERLQALHYRLAISADQKLEVVSPRPAGWTPIPMEHFTDGSLIRFGILSDPHLGNRHQRLDIINAAYDEFERQGITSVFVPGNWIDGEARFNKNELIIAPGFERQISYFLDQWPQRDGITTFILDGDDHEGWYAQREGIEIGRRLIQSARDRGRHDLVYLGYAEADVPMYGVPAEEGGKPAVVRFVHPKGGSSYSISYKPQKIVESYEIGEAPAVLVIGHFHKAGVFTFRECICVLAGCAESQTGFMRGKQLAAHTGFYLIEMQVDREGEVTRFMPYWYKFNNPGYYINRYPVGDIEFTVVA